MKKKSLVYILVILILIIILGVIIKFCYLDSDIANTNDNGVSNEESSNNSNSSVTKKTSGSTTSNLDSSTIEAKDKRGDKEYTDYDATIDLSTLKLTGTGVAVSGNTIKISSVGTYYFTGTLDDGNIEIDCGDDENVVLVFDNAKISCSTTACINGINAKNVIINLKEGTTNTFTDSSEYTIFTEDDEPNGCIFSKTDLKICGTGTLVVNANYEDGIVSKDDLVITDSTIIVKSKDDAIRGKDCVDIQNANITITAGNDGIKSTNEDDETKGYLMIDGGNIEITAGDDGVHAETYLIINDGKVNIKESHEGLEAAWLEINDGIINVKSHDDGLNSTTGNADAQFGQGSSNAVMIINGGEIYVDSDGDGLDSNCIIFSVSGKSGDVIEIKDESGNTVETFTAQKQYGVILVSNEKLTQGKTYTIYVNNEEKSSIELTSVITSEVQGDGMIGGGPRGMQDGNRQMTLPDDMNDEMTPPEGMDNQMELPEDMDGQMPQRGNMKEFQREMNSEQSVDGEQREFKGKMNG